MCVPILRSIGTKLTNLENMQTYMFYLTSCDAKPLSRICHSGCESSDRYFDQEHFETNVYSTFGSKVMAQSFI